MRVNILYFAGLSDRLGRREETLDLAEGGTLADLKQALLARHAILSTAAKQIRWAVNEAYAEDETVLSEGDRVALIPPVSGG